MRIQIAILSVILSVGTAAAADDELVTAPDAILCMTADSLVTASAPPVAKSQIVLRAMGCMRSEAGIPIRLVQNAPDGTWQVRFYPVGMSGGVVLWGRPSSFKTPDRARRT